MKKIFIYASSICSYCISAKRLLEEEKLIYEEILIDNNPEFRNEMIKLSKGMKTVPQIFFDEMHIGGYDELRKIYDDLNLLKLLNEKK